MLNDADLLFCLNGEAVKYFLITFLPAAIQAPLLRLT